MQGSSISQFRMISNKTLFTSLSEKGSDHYYSELSYELDNNPTELENFNSIYDLDNLENIMLFETNTDDEEPYQILLLFDEIARCEQRHECRAE